MSGTKEGGRKAAATNKIRYGNDFYQQIGRVGGENGHTGGFTTNSKLARLAGAKGGKRSKRGSKSMVQTKIEPRRKDIERLYYEENLSIPQIAKRFRLSECTLRRWAKDNLEGYGSYWKED